MSSERHPNWDAAMAQPPARNQYGKLARIVVGAIVAFATMALLYGPQQAGMMVGLAVICTAGVGLIPILFISWLVGTVVLDIWVAFKTRRDPARAV